MKAAKIFPLILGLFIIPIVLLCLALTPVQVQAQDSGYLEPSERYSREELAQMLAPVALYPDTLLSQVLMASTYPIEVIEADRWVRRNPELKGESLDAAHLEMDWDPSVKALCHFPTILALMSERIGETTNLGDAFLAQEAEVMDMVQELRSKAYAQGNLTTTAEQKVIVEKETIIIEPAHPRVVYVPYYDPFSIYGSWWYPAYPPYYWGPSRVSLGFGISYWPGVYFGFTFGSWSYFDWPRHNIYIDVHKRPRFVHQDRWLAKPGPWLHAPSHRRGVSYRDKPTALKYSQPALRSREIGRDFRDFRSVPAIKAPNRDLHQRQRIELERTQRKPQVERQRQERLQVDRDRQRQLRTNRNKMRRQPGTLHKIRRREQVNRERQDRQRTERQYQQPERQRQERRQEHLDRQKRQRVEPEGQQRSRRHEFNRFEERRRERPFSERGRTSPKGRGDGSGQRWRSGGHDWNRDRR